MAIQLRNLEQLQTFNIRTPTAIANTNATSAVKLDSIDGDALFVLTAPASGGADKKITVKIEASNSESTGFEVVGTFPVLGNAAAIHKISVPRSDYGPWFRLNFADREDDYAVAIGVVAIGGARYAV